MKGTTGLKDLRVDCVLGVHAHERKGPQALHVDLEVDYDFAAAARSDTLGDAVNYEAVSATIEKIAQGGGYGLLEALGEDLARALFEQFAAVSVVRLEIRKPSAVPAAQFAYVRLERRRAEPSP